MAARRAHLGSPPRHRLAEQLGEAGRHRLAWAFSARGWFFAAIFTAPVISGVRKWLAIAHPMTSLLKQSITVAR